MSNIRSRAGLVALVFALIISLVSAVPIPATESGLSSTLSARSNLNLHHGLVSTKISTPPAAHTPPQHMDDQLVRRSVGSKIRKAFHNAGVAIKKGFEKVGKGIVKVAKKVGTFVKKNAAVVLKFGLKVAQSIGNVLGHVASFIPVIGKGIQQAIHVGTKIAGVISDHIKAHLSKKLTKGMGIMNKANNVMEDIPRRRDFLEEEAFQQRDIGEANYFEERDDIALESREESYFEAYERDIYERYDLD